MKRHGLLAATLGTVGLTGYLLLSPPHPPTAQREVPTFTRPAHVSLDSADSRWLRAEPRHWRDCIMQH